MELLYVGSNGLQSPTEAAMRVYVCVCVFAEMLLFTPPCVVFSLSQLQSAELQRLEGHRSTLSARTKRRLECRRSNEISGLSSKATGSERCA